MWAFHIGRQIDWAHLVWYRMHKALRLNAHLPYPHLVTLLLQHFNTPLDSEPYDPIKRSFLIDAVVVASFGYRKERDGSWVKRVLNKMMMKDNYLLKETLLSFKVFWTGSMDSTLMLVKGLMLWNNKWTRDSTRLTQGSQRLKKISPSFAHALIYHHHHHRLRPY